MARSAGLSCGAVLGAVAAIDKDFAGLQIHIADLDLDELAHAHGRIEEVLAKSHAARHRNPGWLGRSVSARHRQAAEVADALCASGAGPTSCVPRGRDAISLYKL
jgi:hypothetical protein